MSLPDADLSPLQAHKRLRDHYRDEDEQEWRVREDCESEAAMETHWRGAFAQVPPMLSEQHWPDGPDRRCFAVDGELAEQERRDREHEKRTGDAA